MGVGRAVFVLSGFGLFWPVLAGLCSSHQNPEQDYPGYPPILILVGGSGTQGRTKQA